MQTGAATVGTVVIGSVSAIVCALILMGALQHARNSHNWVAYFIALGAAITEFGIVFQQTNADGLPHSIFTTYLTVGVGTLSILEIVGVFIMILATVAFALFEPVRPTAEPFHDDEILSSSDIVDSDAKST